ncbi:MAG: hypothetical protein R3B57_04910 [Phycisphaerales bacterium]
MHRPRDKTFGRGVLRLALAHAAFGLAGALALAVWLTNTSTRQAPRVVGPYYDPGRLGVWLEERTWGSRSVMFMLARSEIYEDGPDGPRLMQPRPERASPAWATDWSRRIPAMQAAGEMIDPTQTFEHAYGWPAPCLATSEYLVQRANGTSVAQTEHVERICGVVLPTRVWAPGLVIDALALGAPASVTLAGAGMFRVSRRRRRGLCTACAYPIDQEIGVCPECGNGDDGRREPVAA